MDIRYNINRIHSNLSNKYNDVQIVEKESRIFGKYFEITINENKTLKMIVPFRSIDNKVNFEIRYFANPLQEDSELITRNTSADSFVNLTEDIFLNNRFSEEYIKI